MTDVARREATAGSHIGSCTDDKAGTQRKPDRQIEAALEALKAATAAGAAAADWNGSSRHEAQAAPKPAAC